MKYAFIAMGLMALLMIGGGGLINMIFTPLLGGGIEQNYISHLWWDHRADRGRCRRGENHH